MSGGIVTAIALRERDHCSQSSLTVYQYVAARYRVRKLNCGLFRKISWAKWRYALITVVTKVAIKPVTGRYRCPDHDAVVSPSIDFLYTTSRKSLIVPFSNPSSTVSTER